MIFLTIFSASFFDLEVMTVNEYILSSNSDDTSSMNILATFLLDSLLANFFCKRSPMSFALKSVSECLEKLNIISVEYSRITQKRMDPFA